VAKEQQQAASKGDSILRPWFLVRTPRQLAEFFLTEGKSVGINYKSEDEVFQEQGSKNHIVGLLEILVSQFRKESRDSLVDHRDWLKRWKDDTEKLISVAHKEVARVKKLLHGFERSDDLQEWRIENIHWFSKAYRFNRETHNKEYDRLRCMVKRLKSVRVTSDAMNLQGVGKKTLSKIVQSCEVKQ